MILDLAGHRARLAGVVIEAPFGVVVHTPDAPPPVDFYRASARRRRRQRAPMPTIEPLGLATWTFAIAGLTNIDPRLVSLLAGNAVGVEFEIATPLEATFTGAVRVVSLERAGDVGPWTITGAGRGAPRMVLK